jgi:hypothetical protein
MQQSVSGLPRPVSLKQQPPLGITGVARGYLQT